MTSMVLINVMSHYLLYEQGEGEEERVRGEGKREGEGRKRGRGVSVVDVSECPTQSLQQDLETQPHMCSLVTHCMCYCLL